MKYLVQVPFYVAFAAFIAWFSNAPYQHLEPGLAVVKLSFVHAGERKEACRVRSAEELAKLAPNMRAAQDCPRERSDVRVRVEMDGKEIYDVTAHASGLRRDLPSSVYRRLEVPAGRHRFRARMADDAQGAFRHEREAALELAEGRVLVIDFIGGQGGFQFRQ